MPSPFPGMDPYIEMQEWDDFHSRFNVAACDLLAARVEPDYLVRVEKRVYVEYFGEREPVYKRPDVSILAPAGENRGSEFPLSEEGGVATLTEPVEGILSVPEEQEETYLVIKERETMAVVTVIETLSPSNKRPGSDGQREYLSKRKLVLACSTHLVELDLLRGGRRLPLETPYPAADYFAIVSRSNRRPRCLIYPWTVRNRMPRIKIPLLGKEETDLDLQEVFNTVYDRARYDLSIDYAAPLDPPPAEEEKAWIESLKKPSRE